MRIPPAAQTELRRRGYYGGVADGLLGPMTFHGLAQAAAGTKNIPAGTGSALFAVLRREDMLSRLRACHFMAQVGHECGFVPKEENLGYSAKRMTQVWPSRFPTIASAKPYEFQPAKLAEKVYGGRMGNAPGEAYSRRGRGWLQHTGHDGYELIGFLDNPDDLLTVPGAAEGAVRYWRAKNINPLADRNDLVGVTKKINGGTVGLDDRRARLNRLLDIWPA